jgi:hypothetical protein
MPIMAANTQSDPRGAAWLLASSVQQLMHGPGGVESPALQNTYRLLQAYKNNLLVRSSRRGVGQIPDEMIGALSALPASEHLAEISKAIHAALEISFAGEKSEVAVNKITGVLRSVADPRKYTAPEEDRRRAAIFFEQLIRWLAKS